MKKLSCLLGTAFLLAACASAPNPEADAQAHAKCRNVDAPVGSNIVRKADCAPSSPEAAEAARRDIENMQRQQIQRQTSTGYGKS